FDGEPAMITVTDINLPPPDVPPEEPGGVEEPPIEGGYGVPIDPPADGERRKFYFDGGQVSIAAHLVYELDPQGKQLRTVRYTDYAGERVRDLVPSSRELREAWADLTKRGLLIEQLGERGIDFGELAEQAGQPEADPFDLLCHLAFNAPLR